MHLNIVWLLAASFNVACKAKSGFGFPTQLPAGCWLIDWYTHTTTALHWTISTVQIQAAHLLDLTSVLFQILLSIIEPPRWPLVSLIFVRIPSLPERWVSWATMRLLQFTIKGWSNKFTGQFALIQGFGIVFVSFRLLGTIDDHNRKMKWQQIQGEIAQEYDVVKNIMTTPNECLDLSEQCLFQAYLQGHCHIQFHQILELDLPRLQHLLHLHQH